MQRISGITAVLVVFCLTACSESNGQPVVDNHSYARIDDVVVTHIDLDLVVDFEAKRLRGNATLTIDNTNGVVRLHLDTWDLDIQAVRDADTGADLIWAFGKQDPLLGRGMGIEITPQTKRVSIDYETGDDARGVQWLSPEQTADGKHPFLYTQSQAILARSWVPCQDHTAVRFTYNARVHVPPDLMALMSASNSKRKREDGLYEFTMPQPIPSYLLALAVGDVEYRAISDRCGVYAEPSMVEAAAWEFADTEEMMVIAERMYGPYRWDQFDVIVLPPSFPYGGMENPRLTFATPILVAGDRSLVSTIAHELAHSWSGNLVTNATWNDFWLNEGFTTYFERRIMEVIYGHDVSEMHALLGVQDLEDEVNTEPPGDSLDTALYIPLNGRDPDEELGTAPYEKGYLFLRLLEETFGRESFDEFLRGYFQAFAFQSMTTERFIEFMTRELLQGDAALSRELKVDEWVWHGGIPPNAPRPQSSKFERVEAQAQAFAAGVAAEKLEAADWSTQEWEHFLAQLTMPLADGQLAALDKTFALSQANGVVQRSWFKVVIENNYQPAYPALEAYLVRVGRRWLIRGLYSRLAKTDDGLQFARRVYEEARPGYHSTTQATIDGILGLK